ncbi:hypothetical protein M2322_004162 [Rhodoblastus acidophilus]|uniref:hypothetical protein n=1 Tax=Rhodoblastus acidophilus TaxID=1074 RepID=UPI002225960E|nr:hypothetical protein [Rhodoblastus acidophilus]MCW2318593.1 hypothetical protein [Rhodoblastus acidophilus]
MNPSHGDEYEQGEFDGQIDGDADAGRRSHVPAKIDEAPSVDEELELGTVRGASFSRRDIAAHVGRVR